MSQPPDRREEVWGIVIDHTGDEIAVSVAPRAHRLLWMIGLGLAIAMTATGIVCWAMMNLTAANVGAWSGHLAPARTLAVANPLPATADPVRILDWLVEEGDAVEPGDPLVRLSAGNQHVATVATPVAGVVDACLLAAGDPVNGQARLARIAIGTERVLRCRVPEDRLVRATIGQRGTVTFEAIPDTFFAGELVHLSQKGMPDPTTGRTTFSAIIRISSPSAALRLGMTGHATF